MGRLWCSRKGILEAKPKATGMLDASDMIPRLWLRLEIGDAWDEGILHDV